MNATRSDVTDDDDGWEPSERVADRDEAPSRLRLEQALEQDGFDEGTRERLGQLRRGLFDEEAPDSGDLGVAPSAREARVSDEGPREAAPAVSSSRASAASSSPPSAAPAAASSSPPSAAPAVPGSSARNAAPAAASSVPPSAAPAAPLTPRPMAGPPARLPSQPPGDAPEDEARALAALSHAVLRTPTKINPPLGARLEKETWPTHHEVVEQSPGVPIEPDEHEATVVGRASKDILELAASEVNTRVFQAPPELIDLAKRKREENERKRTGERDPGKPEPGRSLPALSARAPQPSVHDIPTPVPATPVSASDAAPPVASESSPPVRPQMTTSRRARAVVDTGPRIDVRPASPDSIARVEAELAPPSNGVVSTSSFKPSLGRTLVRWSPVIVAAALSVYFASRIAAHLP